MFAPLQEPNSDPLPTQKKQKHHHLFTLFIIHMETHIAESEHTLCVCYCDIARWIEKESLF